MSASTVTKIYKLEKSTDNPMLEGFGLSSLEIPSILGRLSLEDDMTAGFKASLSNDLWVQPRLSEKWIPPHVKGRVGSFNDYPCINLIYPALRDCPISKV